MTFSNLKITPKIAELCGIITGDGHLSKYITKRRTNYKIIISGNKTEEVEYFKYISELFYTIFNKRPKLRVEKEYARLCIDSKPILEFFENIGIKVGNKTRSASIPKRLTKNKELTNAFLRGLADTDFGISFKKF